MKNKEPYPKPDPPIHKTGKKRDHAYVGALNIFVNKKGEILLMKRSKQSVVYPNTWGLVGGYLEMGETGAEGAAREAGEEIGVEVRVDRFTGRYYNTSHPYHMIVISLPHYSTIISGKPHAAQPEECSDVRWFKPSEIRKMELCYDHKDILVDEKLI